MSSRSSSGRSRVAQNPYRQAPSSRSTRPLSSGGGGRRGSVPGIRRGCARTIAERSKGASTPAKTACRGSETPKRSPRGVPRRNRSRPRARNTTDGRGTREPSRDRSRAERNEREGSPRHEYAEMIAVSKRPMESSPPTANSTLCAEGCASSPCVELPGLKNPRELQPRKRNSDFRRAGSPEILRSAARGLERPCFAGGHRRPFHPAGRTGRRHEDVRKTQAHGGGRPKREGVSRRCAPLRRRRVRQQLPRLARRKRRSAVLRAKVGAAQRPGRGRPSFAVRDGPAACRRGVAARDRC